MSFPAIPEIPRSDRTKHGRKYQYVAGNRVLHYAYSPHTAKPDVRYNFFADVETKEPKVSPTGLVGSDGRPVVQESKFFTIRLGEFTYDEFRDFVLSGGVQERLTLISRYEWVGAEFVNITYWRNRERTLT